MILRRHPLLAASGILAAAAGMGVDASASRQLVRDSRFFRVDVENRKILEPLPRVAGALNLQLVSISTDQPQYWPNEKVFLKVLAPGAPGAEVKGTLQKRDAAATPITGKLDDAGVLVVDVMDGTQKKLQLGEYRLDVQLSGGKLQGGTTFTVVEGSLGAVSLAFPFERATGPDQLETLKAAWFLGNAGGAGKRWGNGLNFKNQLRVANKPFSGEVEVRSRCMLPGCNGVDAGPSQKMHVHEGELRGTMNVGGHSGPFQIEVITPSGSLRHQFEGSSHVERDMVPISGGVSFRHAAGMAPYENTKQVPGRQIYVESASAGSDAFELANVIATEGAVTLTARRSVENARVVLFNAKSDGTFASTDVAVPGGTFSTGQALRVPVDQPYTFMAVGGFADKQYTEGWAVLFAPTQMKVLVTAPGVAMPARTVDVDVSVTSMGRGVKATGILEVFDNRAVSRNPLHPLGSAIGDSFRNVSHSASAWQDRTGIDEEVERRKAEEMRSRMEKESAREMADEDAPRQMFRASPSKKSMAMGAMSPSAPPPPPAPSMAAPGGAPRGIAAGGRGGSAAGQAPQQEEAPEEVIREDEKKVVFVGKVVTDANGRARVQVTLPPQTGRVSYRFIALHGMDHEEGTAQSDLKRDAFVELQVPKLFVPGARLRLTAHVTNETGGSLTLRATGPGFTGKSVEVGRGTQAIPLEWAPTEDGTVEISLVKGKTPVDVRRMEVHAATRQEVTWSRLLVENGKTIHVGAGESLTAYANAGELMRGMTTQMLTNMESWFGHAEAVGARAATTAVMLAAIQAGVLKDDGQRQSILAMHEKSTRHLEEAFLDGSTGLFRPYPGLPGNERWSAWVCASLHDAIRALAPAGLSDPLAVESLARMQRLVARADAELVKRGIKLEEQGGYRQDGNAVIPVEVDGKVLYRVPTDDTVTRWAVQKFVPEMERLQGTQNDPLAQSKVLDTFRFLRAFERVGIQQYMAEVARGLWESGEKAAAARLVTIITRAMILAQDPGMLQGPALMGGVYSAPRAMVRFLELLLAMGRNGGAGGPVTVVGGSRAGLVNMGEAVAGPATVTLPAGAVARVDSVGVLDAARLPQARHATARLDATRIKVGQQLHLAVELPADADPLEYVAILAVPSTVSIKQTEDILSDSRGVLIFGQQQQGSALMQAVAAPFRGTRSMKLWLEGARPGTSTGWVMVRHIENPQDAYVVAIPDVTVE